MKVPFLGRGKTGVEILESLLDNGYDIPFVWTCRHTSEVGASPDDFEAIADKHNIDFRFVENINQEEYVYRLQELDFDIAVAIFWMDKIREDVLNTANHGFLNLHGGNLPRYRGNAAANWAILEGESQMGVTVHWMAPELDAGPILRQETVPITDKTTINDLVESTRDIGRHLILEVLEGYQSGNPIPATPQDESNALRCYPRLPEYGKIDWTEPTERIDRLVRSLDNPYPTAFTYYNLQKVEIKETSVVKPEHDFHAEPGHIVRTENNGSIWVSTGDEDQLLEIHRIRLEGEDPKPPGTEFRSIRDNFRTDVEKQLRDLQEQISQLEERIDSGD